ncbi:tetratricopeptide repeat protein [Verrucosispora sp. CWR15]|uniref:Tetratricopeptide repeat protein n=1 Tax=Verrucosispora sioxanthis TaxID=2499994 RepID=A0A6M1L924_9ACTN|nr:tetratricopeptide repeat protein [Verrucosispora sioxanthis]NGM14721.1 tetratricopeptide repeat protein [Verrucosispora sioxanthis]
MSADPPAADGYLERATLLAELGRYDEAAAELGFALALDPAAAEVSTMLARVHLAAGRPTEALAAAEAAVAAAPGQVSPLVARGLALGDLERYAEAARAADEILALGPQDAYAQRSAAAILAGSRNGQPALNAAWRAVELAPEEPQGHLVLGLVAANMRMYDLAERAYREALRLDPRLAETADDVGVLRLEQRRWSAALERLAEAAVANLPPTDPRRADEVPDESTRPDAADDDPDRPGRDPDEAGRSAAGDVDASRPAGPEDRPGWPVPGGDEPTGGPVTGPTGEPERGRGEAWPSGPDHLGTGPVVARQPVPAALRQFVLWGAGWSAVAALVVACSTATGSGFSRLLAVVAAAGGGIVLWQQASRLPGLTRTVLPVLRRTDRPLALAVYAAAAAPALILLYALLGTPWPLVLAIAIATAARLAIIGRPVA